MQVNHKLCLITISVNVDYFFNLSERAASSTVRELLAIRSFLLYLKSLSINIAGRTYYWHSGNQVDSYYTIKGIENTKFSQLFCRLRRYSINYRSRSCQFGARGAMSTYRLPTTPTRGNLELTSGDHQDLY